MKDRPSLVSHLYRDSLLSIISKANERGSSFQCGGLLDRQIGMETLLIDWAREEAKMAKIVRYIHVYC